MSEDRAVLDFLRANFARVHERFDRIDARLDGLTTRISALERDVASLSLRVAEIKVDFAAMHGRLDTMDRRIARIRVAAGVGRYRRAGLRTTGTAPKLVGWVDPGESPRGCTHL